MENFNHTKCPGEENENRENDHASEKPTSFWKRLWVKKKAKEERHTELFSQSVGEVEYFLWNLALAIGCIAAIVSLIVLFVEWRDYVDLCKSLPVK